MNKKDLTERDICTKFITPAVNQAGWDALAQIREQVYFTKGRIIVRGKLVTRGKAKFADYILYYKPNLPIALIEAKDNHHPVGSGMQQGLDYAATLDIPFVFSSNGDAFLFHDCAGLSRQVETELALGAFPTPEDLWEKYRAWKGLVPAEEEIVLQNYFDDPSGKERVTNLDDPRILKLAPFDTMGTPVELLKPFGGRAGFEQAVHELQSALYSSAA
jgi:type I restriction enzyme R subunit